MRTTVATLLVAFATTLFAATGDVPLSPVLQAPLPSIGDVAIASSGEDYLVVYSSAQRIYWQRITVEGTAIDPQARRLEGAVLAQGSRDPIKVVWTGETYLVFWSQDGFVMGQAIDRDGIVTERFSVVAGMQLDAARWAHEVAVLTSAGSTWRLTVLNPHGARLGDWTIAADSIFQIVRLDEGWTLVASTPDGLRIVNPQTGGSRLVAGAGNLVASPAGGALVVHADATLSVLRPDGTLAPLSLARPAVHLSVFHAVLVSPSPSGWTVFYRAVGGARIASIRADGTLVSDTPLAGPFPSPDSLLYYHLAAASARDDVHLLLQPAPLGTVLGLESIAVAGSQAYVTAIYAIFDAVQQWGRTAHGPGVDLVAWLESGFHGWDVRATRVKDGAPLDGEGIVLGSSFPRSLDAVYDGEAFSIVWSDRNGTFLRRVDLQGTVLDASPILVSTAAAQEVTIAGSGDGGLVVAWPGAVAYVRGGTVRSTATVGTSAGRQIETGGSRESFLVAFAEPPPANCNLTTCILDEKPVAVQLLTPLGIPSGPLVTITESMMATVGEPISRGGEWFVPIVQPDGPRVLRMTGGASSVIASVATIEGKLTSTAGGIAILGSSFRGLLSSDPENLWYEPLPLGTGEAAEGVIVESPTLLVNTGTRMVLRPLASPAESADIAVVHVSRTGSGDDVVDTVRIEHRAGDPVALHVEIWPFSVQVTSSKPIVNGKIEGPIAAGQTIDLVLRGSAPTGFDRLVIALPFARETAAADNFLLIATEEPQPAKRRRLVAR